MRGSYSFNQYDIAYNVYYLDQATEKWEILKYISYRLLINSKIEINIIEANIMEIELQHEADFEELYLKGINTTLLFERLVKPENGGYNQLFFATNFVQEEKGDEKTFTITGTDWKGYIEDQKIIQHNKFYSLETLPIDPDSGEKQYPDDFNQIVTTGDFKKPFNELVQYFYNRNIINPVKMVKGIKPATNDDLRKIKGFGGINIPNYSQGFYQTVQEKKSLLAFKINAYDYFNSINRYDVFKVEAKLVNKKIVIDYTTKAEIEIDDMFGKTEYSYWKYQQDDTKRKNCVVTESSSEDFDYSEKSKIATRDITKFEAIEESSNEDGVTTSLETNSIQKLEEYGQKIISTLEIEFVEEKFLRDFTAGDFLILTRFNKKLNGSYVIKKISEIIEGDYVSYAVDDMEKIS